MFQDFSACNIFCFFWVCKPTLYFLSAYIDIAHGPSSDLHPMIAARNPHSPWCSWGWKPSLLFSRCLWALGQTWTRFPFFISKRKNEIEKFIVGQYSSQYLPSPSKLLFFVFDDLFDLISFVYSVQWWWWGADVVLRITIWIIAPWKICTYLCFKSFSISFNLTFSLIITYQFLL